MRWGRTSSEFHSPSKPAVAPKFSRSGSSLRRLDKNVNEMSEKAHNFLARKWTKGKLHREVLIEVVLERNRQMSGCLSLPFSLAFFAVYAVAAFLNQDISNSFVIESGLIQHFSGIEAVDSIPGVWSFINSTLLPKLFIQTDLLGQPLPDKTTWSRVLTYNQLCGPMYLKQQRSEASLCGGGEGPVGNMICFPYDSRSRTTFGLNGSNQSYGNPDPGEYAGGNVSAALRKQWMDAPFEVTIDSNRRLHGIRSELVPYVESSPSQASTKFEAFFHRNTNFTLLQQQLDNLQQRGWLDSQTASLQIIAFLLNAELGRPRLEQLEFNFWFVRGGGVAGRLTVQSIFLQLWSPKTLAPSVVWTIMLVGVTIHEAVKLSLAARRGRAHFIRLISKIKRLYEWAIILIGWVCVGFYLKLDHQRASLLSSLSQVQAMEAADIPPELQSTADDLVSSAVDQGSLSDSSRILTAQYQVLLLVRFFTAFHSQPKLGMVMETLEESVMDAIHFMIILLPLFLAYALTGVLIFGSFYDQFATFEGALAVCFEIAVGSNDDWAGLSQQDFWTAGVWVLTFMVLVAMLMLNMVVAIVIGVYSAIRKKQDGKTETVPETLRIFILRYWHRRVWLGRQELVEGIKELPPAISHEQLRRAFPDMCDAQFDDLVTACEKKQGPPIQGIEDTMRMQWAVRLELDQVNTEVRRLAEVSGPEAPKAKTKSPHDPKASWLERIAGKMALQNHRLLHLQWQLQQLEWQWSLVVPAFEGGWEPFAKAATAVLDPIQEESHGDLPSVSGASGLATDRD